MKKKQGFIVLPAVLLTMVLAVGLISAMSRSTVSGSSTSPGTTTGSQSSTTVTDVPVTEPAPEPVEYTLTVIKEKVTGTAPAKISNTDTLTLTFTPEGGYKLPASVTVTGASHEWNSSTGKLILKQASGNVRVTVTGEPDYPYLEVGQSADPRSRYIRIYQDSVLVMSKDAYETGFYHLDLDKTKAVKIETNSTGAYTYFIVYNGNTQVYRSDYSTNTYTIPAGTQWTHIYFIDDN